VTQFLEDPSAIPEPGISEEQARQTVAAAVDTSDVSRIGEGSGFVYAYGYGCCPDRLKIGYTEVDTVQRIAAQIGTGTPDKPVLSVEIKTNNCRALERAIQSILETRGQKINGAGTEWFKTTRDEVIAIYQFIMKTG
jgi:hypothetical protein